MQEHGVLRGGDTKALSSTWLKDAPGDDHFIGSHGRVFDLIVLGKPGRDPKGPRMTTLEAGLFESGRPRLDRAASAAAWLTSKSASEPRHHQSNEAYDHRQNGSA